MDPLTQHRTQKNHLFSDAHHSPLAGVPHGGVALSYYEPDADLVFDLDLEAGDGSPLQVATSDGAERTYRRAATVSFTVDDEPVNLTLYDTGHTGLFLPFRDTTNGSETYGAGRYLDLEPDSGRIVIDFNYAYNPFCAYDDAYSCPLPPAENWLRVPIRAGEREFTQA